MIGLHAGTQATVLDFDIVADSPAGADVTIRTDVCGGSELDVVLDHTRLDDAVGLDVHPFADPARSVDHAARFDARVLPDLYSRVDVGRRGIDHCDSGGHQLLQIAFALYGLSHSQVAAIVYAESFLFVRQDQRFDLLAPSDGDADQVRQVVLALSVVVAERSERVPQEIRIDEIHSGVVLTGLEFFRRGVRCFDDAADRTRVIAQDDSGQRSSGREHHQRRPALTLAFQHGFKGLGAQQWGVAVEHRDVPFEVSQGGAGLPHRVSRAFAFRLENKVSPSLKGGADPIGIPSDDDHQGLGIEGFGNSQGVVEHGLARDRVKHLRESGFHACALASGEDDNG